VVLGLAYYSKLLLGMVMVNFHCGSGEADRAGSTTDSCAAATAVIVVVGVLF